MKISWEEEICSGWEGKSGTFKGIERLPFAGDGRIRRVADVLTEMGTFAEEVDLY